MICTNSLPKGSEIFKFLFYNLMSSDHMPSSFLKFFLFHMNTCILVLLLYMNEIFNFRFLFNLNLYLSVYFAVIFFMSLKC